ncbi:proton-coupled amino acid transporter-like protein CG1139 isoform X2 [Cimex lectularius]|uniref:Amino acid transporter transmembrane domain-containing protein n=1 Tax=Cimex lectularius TaxID=79782 RepID=A0A8I6RFC5_CIMLE|nr:proton-coupled amino acid transporter-like protein CG1139 isoform X2 [Cimex lectularius]
MDEYNPYDHRSIANPTTNLETYIHLIKGCLGTGILAMPDAFKNAGLLMGTIGTILMGFICTYGIHVLVISTNRHHCIISLVNGFLIDQMSIHIVPEDGNPTIDLSSSDENSVGTGTIMFKMAGSRCILSDHYWIKIDVRIIMVVVTLPFILITFIKNLKVLSPVSTLANVITFLGLGFIIYYIFWPDLPKINSVPLFGNPKNLALFFGTILFSLEAIGMVVALENNMETPEAFLGYFGVLNQGMGTVTFLYLLFGFIGYIKYGSAIKGSISLNLPHNDYLAQGVIIAFAIAIFLSFSLQYYVMFEIVWNTWIKHLFDDSKHTLYNYITRIIFVILALLAGLAVPLLGLFISLFGALCLPILGFSFPGLLEFAVMWSEEGNHILTLIKDIALIIFGVLSTVAAVTITSIEIYAEMNQPVPATS